MELNDSTDVASGRATSSNRSARASAFDLIVANPPFVISPSRRYLFRDSALPVDDVCRSLVRSAPAHLCRAATASSWRRGRT